MSIVLLEPQNPSRSYCQRPDWFSQSESAYSLFSKFCYLNHLRTVELVDIVVSRQSRKRSLQRQNPDASLADAWLFDIPEISRIIGLPLKQVQQAFLFHSKIETRQPWETATHLRLCPDCLVAGYHSSVFQINHIAYCPIHQHPLLDHCPHCKRQVPYRLSRALFAKPYHCPWCRQPWARFVWRHNSRPRLLTSSQHDALIELSEDTDLYHRIIETTYTLSKHYLINEQGTACLPEAFQVERKLEYLEFLNFLEERWQSSVPVIPPGDRVHQHHQCGYKPDGNKYKRRKHFHRNYGHLGRSWATDQPYQHSLTLYKALRRYIWRKLIKAHQPCILTLSRALWRNSDKLELAVTCPVSYAFIIWRMYWEWRSIPQSLFWPNQRQCYYGLAVWLTEGAPFIPRDWTYPQGLWLTQRVFIEDCLSSFFDLLQLAQGARKEGRALRWSKLGFPHRHQPYWVATCTEPSHRQLAVDIFKSKSVHQPDPIAWQAKPQHLARVEAQVRALHL